MCMNKRVLIGIGLAIGGLFLVNPAWGTAALPLLIFALCPLMMFLMMRGMGGPRLSYERPSHQRTEGSPAGESADERIGSLQAQVRELKAAQAASDAKVSEQSPSSRML